MSKRALGMIEVKGLLGSVVAADSAAKTADVHIINTYTIKGGWTSVELFGDVSAIQEAISAAKEAVRDLHCYISSNVIANLDPQVEAMILKSLKEKASKAGVAAKDLEPKVEEVVEEEGPKATPKEESIVESGPSNPSLQVQVEAEEAKKPKIEEEPKKATNSKKVEIAQAPQRSTKVQDLLAQLGKADVTSLDQLKVTELRSLAYALEIKSLSKKEIKFANKKTLLENLRNEGVE